MSDHLEFDYVGRLERGVYLLQNHEREFFVCLPIRPRKNENFGDAWDRKKRKLATIRPRSPGKGPIPPALAKKKNT